MNPIDRFAAALEAEGKAEAKVAREAAKLEPLTIVISDQEELRRIYAIVASLPYKQQPVPLIRAHLRGWSRNLLDEVRAERKTA